MSRLALIAALLAAGCQDSGTPKQTARKDAPLTASTDDADPTDAPPPADEPTEPAPDPGKLVADLGAIPAWQAVVDRGEYLQRRGQHGIVYGTLGPTIQIADPASDGGLINSPYTWLVDDTEGNGCLAIRVALGNKTPKLGDRVALAGAWKLDDKLEYFWDVAELTQLPPGPPSDLKDPPSPPGHALQEGPLPPGTRMISLAKDNDLVYFQVTGRVPLVDGDGWPVADQLGNTVVALLNLPGERPSFGAQDFRTKNERWQLKRGITYFVRIGKVRKNKDPLKPANINARTAPVRMK
ncbi:MAG TPA: hypothetical protein VMZ53_08525 [Kofleriaceae bacterium]|nr:hypothetical protein [Kofleriaceae bacterium]